MHRSAPGGGARLSLPLRGGLLLLTLGLVLALLPRQVVGRAGPGLYRGHLDQQRPLAEDVAARVNAKTDVVFYHTGFSRFDGQSAVAIYQMTLLGLGQVALEHPELRAKFLPVMRVAARRLAEPSTLAYAAHVYGQHGVSYMAPGAGHAYLGYINLGLGMLRRLEPDMALAPLHDRLSEQLATRLFSSETGLIETYPGETWPPDVAAVAGSIGLHALATGGPRAAQVAAKLKQWEARFARCAIDKSGYLVQRTVSHSCQPADAPRGSGTAVASYFLSFGAPELSKRLFSALEREGQRSLFGFGGVAEYASGFSGPGDGNAGPILFGVSVGATGFAIGAARANQAPELYLELYRTAALFGIPTDTHDTRSFAVGGALGNALLLAMLTARPAEAL